MRKGNVNSSSSNVSSTAAGFVGAAASSNSQNKASEIDGSFEGATGDNNADSLFIEQVISGQLSLVEIERHLLKLYITNKRFAKVTNDSYIHLLKYAITSGNVDLLKILLRFDYRGVFRANFVAIEEQAFGFTQIENLSEARRLAYLNNYALIIFRMRWQDRASIQDIPLLNSLYWVEESFKQIETVPEGNPILFFGVTGHGKSTFVNYLLGVDYNIVKMKNGISRAVKKDELMVEPAVTGHSTSSETLYPKIFNNTVQLSRDADALSSLPEGTISSSIRTGRVEETPSCYVDLPGLEETRGTPEEIASAAATCWLVKRFANIKSLCVAIEWNELIHPKMLAYRTTLKSIQRIVGNNKAIMQNIILVVTKPEDDLTIADVEARLNGFNTDEPEDIITKSILTRAQTHIVIADIKQSAARNQMNSALNLCSSQPSNLYNFEEYTNKLSQFKTILTLIQNDIASLENQIIILRKQIQQNDSNQNTKCHQLDEIKNESNKCSSSCSPFDQRPFESKREILLKAKQSLIEEERNNINAKERLEGELRMAQQAVANIHATYSHEGGLSEEEVSTIVHSISDRSSNSDFKKSLEKWIPDVQLMIIQAFSSADESSKRLARRVMLPQMSIIKHPIVKISYPNGIDQDKRKKDMAKLGGSFDKIKSLNQDISNLQTRQWEIRDKKRENEVEISRLEVERHNGLTLHSANLEILQERILLLQDQRTKVKSELTVLTKEGEALKEKLGLVIAIMEVNSDFFASLEKMKQIFPQSIDVMTQSRESLFQPIEAPRQNGQQPTNITNTIFRLLDLKLR